jgi:hypothetical protein
MSRVKKVQELLVTVELVLISVKKKLEESGKQIVARRG